MVRKHYLRQYPFDRRPIAHGALNLEYRDEIIPALSGLQFLYITRFHRKAGHLMAVNLTKMLAEMLYRPLWTISISLFWRQFD